MMDGKCILIFFVALLAIDQTNGCCWGKRKEKPINKYTQHPYNGYTPDPNVPNRNTPIPTQAPYPTQYPTHYPYPPAPGPTADKTKSEDSNNSTLVAFAVGGIFIAVIAVILIGVVIFMLRRSKAKKKNQPPTASDITKDTSNVNIISNGNINIISNGNINGMNGTPSGMNGNISDINGMPNGFDEMDYQDFDSDNFKKVPFGDGTFDIPDPPPYTEKVNI